MHKNTNKPSQAAIINTFNICVLSGAIALVTSITGCSQGLQPEVNEPTKLVKLAQSIKLASPVLSVNIPSDSKIAGVSRFEVGFDNQQIVVGASSGNVESYDLSGNRLWSTDLGDTIVGGVGFDTKSQTAIVTTKSANVVALDTSNGNIKWQTELKGTVLAPALIHHNRVVLSGNDGVIHGLSLHTGAIIWQFATQTPSISVRGSATPTLLDDKMVLIGSADGRLHALDSETGIPSWSRRVGIPSGSSEIQRMTDVDATPTVDNNQLFSISYSGQLIGVDLNSRQIMFVEDAASKNRLAVIGNAVISTTLEGMVNAHNRQTGELLWQSDELAYRKLSNPVNVGGYIAIGDLDGVVHFLSPTDGRIVSRTKTKGAINYLKASNGYLMTQTQAGQVNVWQIAR